MKIMTVESLLLLLSSVAIFYILWIIIYFEREKWQENRKPPDEKKNLFPLFSGKPKEIMGKSKFTMPDSKMKQNRESESDVEEDKKNDDTFAESNAPEHPRQVPAEELDKVFEEEENNKMDFEYPLPEEDPDEEEDEENQDEDLPIHSQTQTRKTRTFEEMGEAITAVVHNPPMTDDKKRDTGRILLEMKQTDMFEAVVSGNQEREKRVTNLIDYYLSGFYTTQPDSSGGSPSPQAVPFDFDIRNFL